MLQADIDPVVAVGQRQQLPPVFIYKEVAEPSSRAELGSGCVAQHCPLSVRHCNSTSQTLTVCLSRKSNYNLKLTRLNQQRQQQHGLFLPVHPVHPVQLLTHQWGRGELNTDRPLSHTHTHTHTHTLANNSHTSGHVKQCSPTSPVGGFESNLAAAR